MQRNRMTRFTRTNHGDVHGERSTMRFIRQIQLGDRDNRPSHTFQLTALPNIATPLHLIRTVVVAIIFNADFQFRISEIERDRSPILKRNSRNHVSNSETRQTIRQ